MEHKNVKWTFQIRNGKEAEAWPLLEEVEAGAPREEHVLTAVQHAFKVPRNACIADWTINYLT